MSFPFSSYSVDPAAKEKDAVSVAAPPHSAPGAVALAGDASSSSSTLSPLDFLQQVHAAFKRHRPIGAVQPNFPRATRVVHSRMELCKGFSKRTMEGAATEICKEVVQEAPLPIERESISAVGCSMTNVDETLLTPPTSGTITDSRDEEMQRILSQKMACEPMVDSKKQPFDICSSQEGSYRMPEKSKLYSIGALHLTVQNQDLYSITKTDNTSGHNQSLALMEGDIQLGDQGKIKQNEDNRGSVFGVDVEVEKANICTVGGKDDTYNHQNIEPMTRFSALGSSVTTLTVQSGPTFQSSQAPTGGQTASQTHIRSCVQQNPSDIGDHNIPNRQGPMVNNVDFHSSNLLPPKIDGVVTGIATSDKVSTSSQELTANNQSTSTKKSSQQAAKGKKVGSKSYDPDLFFKVNGKLYQKLGKIGSGGSSEVYKVISSDCTIYALKKIKLKGRDYPTAYGFCQEIDYLNRLKGKNNIIQLMDYEVTDKSLLENTSMGIKDGRIKDDHYIYMVLEYGETDLAHMVAHKRIEMSDSCSEIDENWLRFYWQQMLEAVNTIHEERIVHSDLKPANFLLVKGSLKLIDFGIAKAILNDTTNIQRDTQVGTLNYMSPEAFMCNDNDADGNTIKCGRPSDIWSLGCILYQMVYGKTPFSDYKSFWSKFRVVTDKNHKIIYEPVSNPWLVDLMQKCLSWDRNERWRIPELLQHPFLVPRIPAAEAHTADLLLDRITTYWNNPEVTSLCSKLLDVITRLEAEQTNSN